MAIALVANTLKAPGQNGGTTDAIDTTGATLLVLVVSELGFAISTTPTDSKGNTWTARTKYGVNNASLQTFYAENPVVGTGHTFTYSLANSYPVIMALAFSGTVLTSVYDKENGASNSSGGTSLATGSVTPAANNSLLVAGVGADGLAITSASINGGFSISNSIAGDNATRVGGGAAYLIQTTATAANPTWSWTNNGVRAANITVFKAAATGYTLAIDPGSFAVTGTNFGLAAQRKMALDPGSYVQTGTNFALTAQRKMAVDPGSYSMTGTDIAFRATRTLSIAAGAYALTGTNFGLAAQRTLAIDSGSYSLTGTDISFTAPTVLLDRRFRMRHYGLVAKERRNTEVIDGLDGN